MEEEKEAPAVGICVSENLSVGDSKKKEVRKDEEIEKPS